MSDVIITSYAKHWKSFNRILGRRWIICTELCIWYLNKQWNKFAVSCDVTPCSQLEYSTFHRNPEYGGRLRLKCDGTRTETRFRLSAKRTSPSKSAGCQFCQLLAAEVCSSAVVMVATLDTPCSEVVWRVLATHSIRQSPLHFPSCVPSRFNWTLLH